MSSGKRLINPWDVIDTFFRDTSYYKSQHQIDSFDEFIFSEENGIRNIIKRENPFIIYKGQDPKKPFVSMYDNAVNSGWFNTDSPHDNSIVCENALNIVKKYYSEVKNIKGYDFWAHYNTRPKEWHYDKDEDFAIVEVRREKGYNVIRIRSIPTYNFDNVIIH